MMSCLKPLDAYIVESGPGIVRKGCVAAGFDNINLD